MTYEHYMNPKFKDYTWTIDVQLDRSHKFEELGSLASECLNCGIQYALAKDHRGWIGRPCAPVRYSGRELQDITNEYCKMFPF